MQPHNWVVIGLLVSEIIMFESVNARTDARTPAQVPSYKLTLWAFGSGELKSGNIIFPIISLWGYFLDAQGQLTL